MLITLLIGGSFFLVFFATKTTRFLQTSLFEDEGLTTLGFAAFVVNFLF
jgi:hypothetical protein